MFEVLTVADFSCFAWFFALSTTGNHPDLNQALMEIIMGFPGLRQWISNM
jgi:hypothetical protein